MARLEITGIDGLMGDLTRAGSQLRPVIEEALKQSGEALAEEVLAQEERFKAPTGRLGESITLSDVWHRGDASGVYMNYEGMYEGGRGGNERAGASGGRRAAFVAAMQEYQNKRPFNRRARKKAEPRINAIIAEALGKGSGSVRGDVGGL